MCLFGAGPSGYFKRMSDGMCIVRVLARGGSRVRRPIKRDEFLPDVTAHPPETQGRAGERTHFPAEQLECVTRDGPPPGQKKHPLLHGYPNMPRRKSKKTKPTVAGILGLGL